jgi:hypothetical protein
MKRFFGWLRRQFTLRNFIVLAVITVVYILLAIGGIQVWEWSNSPEFCADACHDVHPEEIPAYQDSYHAQVKCVECHMGRLGTLRNMALKVTHAGHLPAVLFENWERPLVAKTTRPANESCEKCHWPESFHDDTVREIKSYQTDVETSPLNTYLILKTGGGTAREGLGKGIHWHIENQVEYIATDPQKTTIPWVRVTFQDGRTVVYQDATWDLSQEQIDNADKLTVDCVSCHNRVGHPFPYPELAVDEALSRNRLDGNLPEVKAKAMALLTAEYESKQEALEAVEQMRERYMDEYPQAAAANPESIAQAEQTLKEILERITFEEEEITWRSFPDHNGHDEFAGCFRCHDGKHLDADGNSIRLHCNLCHSLPEVVTPEEGAVTMEVANVQEPESHLEPSFMADHRFLANDECTECHGPIQFGDDDSSFCANSACHERSWPQVDLSAEFAHPIELVGVHAEAWCHDCHEGVAQPSYACQNCHLEDSPHGFEPGDCSQCHFEGGPEWTLLQEGALDHNVFWNGWAGKHTQVDCTGCHFGDYQSVSPLCEDCHMADEDHYDTANCDECHVPDQPWEEATSSG